MQINGLERNVMRCAPVTQELRFTWPLAVLTIVKMPEDTWTRSPSGHVKGGRP